MIHPTAIKSYRYKDGSSYTFDAADGQVLILDGPLVVKSISLSLTNPSTGANEIYARVVDGIAGTVIFELGRSSYPNYYPSVYRVNIPGAGMRFDTSLVMEVIDTAPSSDTGMCSNLNIGYQR